MNSALVWRRWGIIVAAGLSGVLALVSMFVDPAPSADGRELIEAYAGSPGRQGLHTNLLHYGFALFAPVAYALVGLVRGRGAWLANLAGVLAIIGLSTLPGLVMVDFATVAMANVTDVDTALAASEEMDKMAAFGLLVAPAFLASLLALPVAAAAMARAGLFRWWVAVLVTIAFLGVNAIPDAVLGFAVISVAMMAMAYELWRVPAGAWLGRTDDLGSAAHGDVRNAVV
jgi:hypothetical protein